MDNAAQRSFLLQDGLDRCGLAAVRAFAVRCWRVLVQVRDWA